MKHVVFVTTLATLAACTSEKPAPDLVERDPVGTEPTLVGPLPADASDSFGTWDGQVYLVRYSGMEADEIGEWAPFAVGEVYGEPATLPLGAGLPDMPEGCFDATTFTFPDLALADIGPTLPLVVGPYTFDLERGAWNGGFDYWRNFVNDLECDCASGTSASFPGVAGSVVAGEVVVPEAVVLADDFADQWATWSDTGTLDLRWTPGTGGTRLIAEIWYRESDVWQSCILDDDGAALLELPVRDDPDVSFTLERVASRAVVHPTYGTMQLTARDMIYPLLAAR